MHKRWLFLFSFFLFVKRLLYFFSHCYRNDSLYWRWLVYENVWSFLNGVLFGGKIIWHLVMMLCFFFFHLALIILINFKDSFFNGQKLKKNRGATKQIFSGASSLDFFVHANFFALYLFSIFSAVCSCLISVC